MTVESLSDENIIKVKRYLGYPTLANRFNLYASVPLTVPTALLLERHVRAIDGLYALSEIEDLIEEIECSRKLIKAASKRAGVSEVAYSVKFNNRELSILWEEDYKIVEQLADLIFVPIYKHPTGRGLYYEIKGSGGNQTGII